MAEPSNPPQQPSDSSKEATSEPSPPIQPRPSPPPESPRPVAAESPTPNSPEPVRPNSEPKSDPKPDSKPTPTAKSRLIPSGCGKCGYSFAGHSLPPERCPECGWDARACEELDEQPTPDPRAAITPGVIGCGLVWIGVVSCALALAFSNALLYTVPIVWIGVLLCLYSLFIRPRGERIHFPMIIALGVVAFIAYFTWPAIIYPAIWLHSVLFR